MSISLNFSLEWTWILRAKTNEEKLVNLKRNLGYSHSVLYPPVLLYFEIMGFWLRWKYCRCRSCISWFKCFELVLLFCLWPLYYNEKDCFWLKLAAIGGINIFLDPLDFRRLDWCRDKSCMNVIKDSWDKQVQGNVAARFCKRINITRRTTN